MPASCLDKTPVYSRYGLQFVDPSRLADLVLAPNVEVVRRRDGRISQLNLLSFDVDHDRRRRKQGNPQSLIHNHESETNPPRVWELKRV